MSIMYHSVKLKIEPTYPFCPRPLHTQNKDFWELPINMSLDVLSIILLNFKESYLEVMESSWWEYSMTFIPLISYGIFKTLPCIMNEKYSWLKRHLFIVSEERGTEKEFFFA